MYTSHTFSSTKAQTKNLIWAQYLGHINFRFKHLVPLATSDIFFLVFFNNKLVPTSDDLHTRSVPILIKNQFKFIVLPQVIWYHSRFRHFLDSSQDAPRRREQRVHANPKHIIDERRYDFELNRAMRSEVGIRIYLQNPNFVIFVNHKIHSHQLEPHFSSVRVNFPVGCSHTISGDRNHLRYDVVFEDGRCVLIARQTVNIFFQVRETQFQPNFIFLDVAVIAMLLDSVIGQVHDSILAILEIVLARSRPNITLIIPESFELPKLDFFFI